MNKYKTTIEEITKAVIKSNDIYLSSHVNPDGDSIGSMMALGLALKQLNKNIHFIKTDTIPDTFKFLPGIDQIQEFKEIKPDILFVLDCGSKDRIGDYNQYISKSKIVINIDHHLDNDSFGDINIVDSSRASTGEIIYDVIQGLNLKLNKEIATHLYTAISMDSGRFMYDKVDDQTHEIIANLIRTGIDKDEININLYQKRSMAATKLFIEGLSSLKTYCDEKVATIKVTQEALQATKANLNETDGLISFIRDIDTIEVACLLKEIDSKEIKISLRSKTYIDVSSICNIFGGGGHKRAAGCTIYQDINNAEKLIINEIERSMRV